MLCVFFQRQEISVDLSTGFERELIVISTQTPVIVLH